VPIDEAEAEEAVLLLTRSLRASMAEGSRTTKAPALEACGEALEACGGRAWAASTARCRRRGAGGRALGCGIGGRRER
jgi:hypothetical protein